MNIWFFSNSERLELERTALNDLDTDADWLKGFRWCFHDSKLAIEAEIESHGNTYAVRLLYPNQFPFTAPIVRPIKDNTRWSDHQYADGTLCLEWGPDTWRTEVSGAEVLSSAFKLFELEDPLGESERPTAPSRHYLTQGQATRSSFSRYFLSSKLREFLNDLPTNSCGEFKFTNLHQGTNVTFLPTEFTGKGSVEFVDASVPKGLTKQFGEGYISKGEFYKGEFSSEVVQSIKTRADFVHFIAEVTKNNETATVEDSTNLGETQTDGGMLIDSTGMVHFFRFFESENVSVATCIEQQLPAEHRNPFEWTSIDQCKIGIVGLGSLGSKVAVSLARMGARSFVLVDDDVFFPENVCRNALSWRNVGQHKAEAVAREIELLIPESNVKVDCAKLCGQENTAYAAGVLGRLESCDIIFDMTGNSSVFNLLAGISVKAAVPFVWATVLEGGIGGLLGRFRPGLDPDPLTMRAAYHKFAEKHPFESQEQASDYGTIDDDGDIIVASDADVSSIASHATSIGTDTLLGATPSRFPYSLYLVGLIRSWVFSAPFCTIPIETDDLDKTGGLKAEVNLTEDQIEFLGEVLKSGNDSDSNS